MVAAKAGSMAEPSLQPELGSMGLERQLHRGWITPCVETRCKTITIRGTGLRGLHGPYETYTKHRRCILTPF
jgi:hypothetical protein